MAKIDYLLETQDGVKHTVCVSWKGIAYIDGALPVTIDGEAIGSVPDKAALKTGHQFILPDGTAFTVTIEGRYITAVYNGEYLPAFEQPKDLHVHMRSYYVTYFIGGYSLFVAAVMPLFSDFNTIIGAELYWLAAGALFLMLGYFVKRGSAATLAVALLFYILDTVSLFILPLQDKMWIWTMVMVHITLMYPLLTGIFAINRLKKQQAQR